MPPFPEDYTGDYNDFRSFSGYQDLDYPRFSHYRDYGLYRRDCSPYRYGSYRSDFPRDFQAAMDFKREYRMMRDCSPMWRRRFAGDYDDCFDYDRDCYAGEFDRVERRSRAMSRGRSRFDSRPSMAMHMMDADCSPSRYEEYRRQHRMRHRSLSPVPFYGYSTMDRTPEERHEVSEVRVRARSLSPAGRRVGFMTPRDRMSRGDMTPRMDMASRVRRDNERRSEFSATEADKEGFSKRRETSVTRQTETVGDDNMPMTSDMSPARRSRFLR